MRLRANVGPGVVAGSGASPKSERSSALALGANAGAPSRRIEWRIPVTFVRHQIGAVVGTVADFGTMSALVQLLRVHPVVATGIGAAVWGITNFLLGRHWVFGAVSNDARVQALKYALVSAGSLGANMLGEHALHDLLGLHYVLARVLTAVSVAVLWNYPLQRSFVFRARDLRQAGSGNQPS